MHSHAAPRAWHDWMFDDHITMYRILFVIAFAGTMWPGFTTVEKLVAARAKYQATIANPEFTLGLFLRLVREETNITIIDMRQAEDYARSHIKDAVNVHQFDAADAGGILYDRLGKARVIILYSDDGVSDNMRQYAQALSKRGIKAIGLYSGGFREWFNAGLPVEGKN